MRLAASAAVAMPHGAETPRHLVPDCAAKTASLQQVPPLRDSRDRGLSLARRYRVPSQAASTTVRADLESSDAEVAAPRSSGEARRPTKDHGPIGRRSDVDTSGRNKRQPRHNEGHSRGSRWLLEDSFLARPVLQPRCGMAPSKPLASAPEAML